MAMDPRLKMLASLLGLKPEDFQGAVAGIGQTLNYFKVHVDTIERATLDNGRALSEIKAQLERIEHAAGNPVRVIGAGDAGYSGGNGGGDHQRIVEPGSRPFGE